MPRSTRDDKLHGVSLCSNIGHSIYAARGLSKAGLLADYYSPLMVRGDERAVRIMPRWLKESLAGRIVGESLPRVARPMRSADLLQQAVLGLGLLSADKACAIGARAFETQVALAMRNSPAPRYFHYHNPIGVNLARRLSEEGSVVICDERAMHVDTIAEKRQEGASELSSAASTWRRDLARRGYEEADYILVASKLAAVGFLARGFEPHRIIEMPLGVDTQFFAPLQGASPEEGKLKILFVGRLGTAKGYDVLLSAMAAAPKSMSLRVAGVPDPLSAVQLSRNALRNVTILGQLPKAELLHEYRRADVMVLPSRFDSFGLVALEALACGTPVVVTDKCGIASELRSFAAARVIPSNDAPALSAALTEALTRSQEERLSISKACRAWAVDHDWESYQRRLVNFYVGLEMES